MVHFLFILSLRVRMHVLCTLLIVCSAFGEINDDDDRDACVMCCFCGLNISALEVIL